MAELILGPVLRYVSDTEATVWAETDSPCEVEVLDPRAPTFGVDGHPYALVCVDGLEPEGVREYEVALASGPSTTRMISASVISSAGRLSQ